MVHLLLGIRKLQVVVAVPKLPPGPTSVVQSRNRQVLLTVPADELTMLRNPLGLDEKNEATVAGCYQAGALTPPPAAPRCARRPPP